MRTAAQHRQNQNNPGAVSQLSRRTFGKRNRWTSVGSVIALALSFLGATVFVAPAHAASPTIVTLTFDDGNDNQVAAAATLKAAGLRGTFFVTSGYLNSPSYMTTAQVQALQADGHEIGGHTVTHPDLAVTGADEAKRQVCNDRVNLTNAGLNIQNFAYPFASSTPAVETIVKNCGYNSARGLGDVRSVAPESAGMPVAATLPPADLYYTAALDQVESNWTLKDLQRVVNQAKTKGGWIQLTFHSIGRANDELSISTALYQQYVNWLRDQKAAGAIQVKTVREVIGGVTKPVVPGPVAPPPNTTDNLVQNPSLETAGATAGTAKCWSPGGYGTNTPVFKQVAGRTGKVAQQLTMSGYKDGDAKLLPTLDMGECAPTGQAGQKYSLKAWYKSTAYTQFDLYYRTGAGSWNYWTSSPYLNASSSWTQGSWTSPPLPAGATAVSFGLNLFSNGVLTTDDYSLTIFK
ncbi:polysaccharide deacetylase family protein [Arthrobacter gengyunqii]|uniref:Polysaccharide deacetylase family protein n=1 Tax=Arthrobacter gengyunqii TaxID=2886940 RepID=A0ABS8GDW7_9MICC|nr:polysaccharide deacetylase family protein [Arthrobacter gengyunqii]MCC3264826.1 polysaccharide deacetylase family protein [Arthrobacter gengyunqii]